MNLTRAGKTFLFISALFGAICYMYYQQGHFWNCAWFGFLSGFEFRLAMKSRKTVTA